MIGCCILRLRCWMVVCLDVASSVLDVECLGGRVFACRIVDLECWMVGCSGVASWVLGVVREDV